MNGLTPLPPRMQKLAIDARGYPVPWFVDWVDGRPKWGPINLRKWAQAINEKCCWVCGFPLETNLDFIVDPVCGISRITSEPPCHRDCARWSIKNFPLLLRSEMHHEQVDLAPEMQIVKGILLRRHPGVILEWTCQDYLVIKDGLRSYKFDLGKATKIDFWLESRRAEPVEIETSIKAGLNTLQQNQSANEILRLQQAYDRFQKLAMRYRPDLRIRSNKQDDQFVLKSANR